jgi:hypothetical protein
MSHEVITQVKRTIYVAECPKCHDRVEHTERIAKERYCNGCGVWIPFEEISYIGPALPNRV